jgi:hypothetical protein
MRSARRLGLAAVLSGGVGMAMVAGAAPAFAATTGPAAAFTGPATTGPAAAVTGHGKSKPTTVTGYATAEPATAYGPSSHGAISEDPPRGDYARGYDAGRQQGVLDGRHDGHVDCSDRHPQIRFAPKDTGDYQRGWEAGYGPGYESGYDSVCR